MPKPVPPRLVALLGCALGLAAWAAAHRPALAFEPPQPCAARESGRVVHVGPERALKTPSEAAEVAKLGDTVLIDPGVYEGDAAVWRADGLRLVGNGGRAVMDGAGLMPAAGAIWVLEGRCASIDNIEFRNASALERNGAALRLEQAGLVVRNSVFRDNEIGVASADVPGSVIHLERNLFINNGFGGGFGHAVHVGRAGTLVFRFNEVVGTELGHHLKSRASRNYIAYNRLLDGEGGTASYTIDLPDGGDAVILGNAMHQAASGTNWAFLHYAGRAGEVVVAHNTALNEADDGRFLFNESSAITQLLNNVVAGAEEGGVQVADGPARSRGTVEVTRGDFVDAARFDYRLREGSAAIGAAVSPAGTGASAPVPVHEQRERGKVNRRQSAFDAGAFEFIPGETGSKRLAQAPAAEGALDAGAAPLPKVYIPPAPEAAPVQEFTLEELFGLTDLPELPFCIVPAGR